jgi:hypothetical protein
VDDVRIVAWWVLCLVTGFPVASRGDDVPGTRLAVSATVLAHARLESNETPVQITPADVARGYVEVSRRFALLTNAPGRVLLQFQPRAGYAQAVDIAGLGPTLRMLDTALEVPSPATRELQLSFRLWLDSGLEPGEYPWPLHVGAVAL